MNPDGTYRIDEAYDDGVVCFGPVTESQIERYQRLPRHTVLPSDLKSILCSDDEEFSNGNEENAKDEQFNENCDQSVRSYLDQSKASTVVQVDEINTTRSTINFDNKENEASSLKYPASSFASPCVSQFVPSADLIATEVLNRYIRMETTLSDESFSEYQDKSAFEGETVSVGGIGKEELNQDEIVCENVSFTDVQKREIIHDNSIKSEITSFSSPVPVSSVIEKSYNANESNLSGNVDNICSLKHRSHEDENDESICSISELEDDSIVPDKYSITPGKQRLFDVRNLKRSFHVKTGTLMERIEESTTPVILKTPTSHAALNEVSCTPSEIKTNLDVSLSKSIDFSSSAVDFSDVKDSVCNNSVINVSCGEEKMCINNLGDESMSANSLSAENNTLDSNVSLGIINNCSKGQSNVMRQYLDLNQTQIENVSSADINSTLNESEDYCDQSQSNFSIIEQTTCSETDSKKDDESFSIFDDLPKSTLSVIIENRTLEDKEIIIHNGDDETNTEVSNRYIGLENTFSGKTVSVDDKEKEELNQDEIVCENVSFTDVQKEEIIHDNSIKIEITSLLPVSSVIEQFNDAKENNSSDAANNSCSLKYRSHGDENDESICSNSGVEDDSIVPDKFSTTPGKQRLFDVRNLNQSFPVKLDVLMDKIEKFTSPVIQKTPISQSGSNEEKVPKNILCDEPMCTNSFSIANNTLDSDVSLSITNNCLKKLSNITKQYLDLNQIQVGNVSSSDINSTLNESEDYCNQSQSNFSIVEQTTCSKTSDSKKNDESFSTLDNLSKSALSVIENKILENEKNVIDVSYNSVSKNIMNEETHNEILIKSTQEAITIAENDSKSHVIELSTINVTSPLEKEVHENVNNFTDLSVIGSVTSLNESEDTIGNITLDSCFLLENSEISRIETKIMTEVENKLRGDTSEQIISQNIETDDWNLSHLTDISTLNTSELILKSERALHSLNNQRHSLNTTDTMSESLAEYNKIEQMLFEENDKVCEFKTPKTQKLLDLSTVKKPFVCSLKTQQLLDFSIVQQSPFLVNSAKKQKLINFSIVDQSPVFKTTPQSSFNHNSTKADTSIDFNSTNQMWDLGAMPANEIDFQKCFPNSLLTPSSSNVESVADESVKTNSSDHSDVSFNRTITETNLMKPNTSVNQQKVEDKGQLTEKDDLAVSTNKQIEINESSKSLNTTVAQNESCNEQPVKEFTIKGLKHGSEHVFETSNIGSIIGSNQQVTLSSNEYGIQDFSIVEQSKTKNVENIIPADSAYDVSNLIEMSVANTPCNKQFVVSNIPILTVTSHESEKTLNSSSSDVANNTAINFEESQLSGEELLTNIQMNDVSLLVESSDKSSVSESFHSIELDHHIQEDKKRKTEPIQGKYHTEKKMKINTDDELQTPTSMLYKIRNMFRSSEKQLHILSNTKENDSGAFRQKLDFNMCNENRTNIPKSLNYKKSETFAKSKIPCKVTDVSTIQNEGSNVLSSLNDNNVIKPKKTIPKFTGLPVLLDVSNSTKKCPGSRTPSRFQQ